MAAPTAVYEMLIPKIKNMLPNAHRTRIHGCTLTHAHTYTHTHEHENAQTDIVTQSGIHDYLYIIYIYCLARSLLLALGLALIFSMVFLIDFCIGKNCSLHVSGSGLSDFVMVCMRPCAGQSE